MDHTLTPELKQPVMLEPGSDSAPKDGLDLWRIMKHGSFALLLLLMLFQYILCLYSPWRKKFESDEQYYVDRAITFTATGVPVNVPNFRFRPAGYPIVIALSNLLELQSHRVRYRTATVQFFSMMAVLIALFVIAARSLLSSSGLYAAAILIGTQPWCFSSVKILYPDSLTSSALTAGLLLLFGFLRSKRTKSAVLFLFSAIIAFSLTAALRIEMVALMFAFLTIAISLKFFRKLALFVIVFNVLWIGIAAYAAHERLMATGKVRTFGIVKKGAYAWVGTWFSTERTGFKHFLYGPLTLAKFKMLPSHAFANSLERRQVRGAVETAEEQHKYNRDTDATFRALAQKRRADRFWMNNVLPAAWATLSMWINFDINEQIWELSRWRQYLFFPVLAIFALYKIVVFAMAAGGAYRLFERIRNRELKWYDDLTILMLVCIVSRSLLMGGFLGWIHRYVLPAWPALIWLAITVLFDNFKIKWSAARA